MGGWIHEASKPRGDRPGDSQWKRTKAEGMESVYVCSEVLQVLLRGSLFINHD